MKSCLLCALFLTTLVSCSKYQYASLSSNVPKSKNGFVIIENDTMAVRYSFSGHRGPVKVEVFNKLAIPLSVTLNSWSMTRLTWPNAKPLFTASTNPSTFQQDDVADYLQSEYPVYNLLLPSLSSVVLPEIVLRENFFKLSTPDMVNRQMNGDLIRAQVFTKSNTPLRFVHRLTYSPQNGKAGIMHHEFWVDEVFISMIRPEHVSEYKGRQNMFYIKKPSGAGVFVASIGLLTYLAVSQASD
jgi:hypothetical protein